ncbi:MAG: phosphoethanolamine--lipid A transferase [Rugosibacter sp.]|nr:phosphoethanolamine--lipid A transferase [Rugosibacter sp.]
MLKTGLSTNTLLLLTAAFLLAFGNVAFISNVLKAYPITGDNAPALISLIVVFGGVIVLLFAMLCFKQTTKPVLITFLLLSSLAAYFMDTYGTVISEDMLRNVAHTNMAETLELFTLKLLAYFMFLGVVPALAIGKVPLQWHGLRAELISRLKLFSIMLVLLIGSVLAFGNFYASFSREHKVLRSYANPGYYVYSVIRYANHLFAAKANGPITAVATDAKIPAWDIDRELIILVVGETARADRFSLNGYQRDTNPRLQQKNVISFTNFWACGTSTAVSIPCMFLLDGESGTSAANIDKQENLLDVLQYSGVNVLWLDNNSDSKHVAARVPFQDFKSPRNNPICDMECRDEGMLSAIQPFIDAHPKGDILIVMHQMGNHGPAYYKRYPPAFEKFTPTCKSSDLSLCTQEEIGNAYDNAILYTDDFLAKTINMLEKNDHQFETALLYVSDHGESLGEKGLYLHGLPKMIAPEAQLHIPAVMWFGSSFHGANVSALRMKRAMQFTHANLFHTILGLLEIETATYRHDMDMLEGTRAYEKPVSGQ